MSKENTAAHVILVDEQDRAIGTAEKMQAHRQGLLHRAFSIFIVNSGGEMLLQKRAAGKYHSGGLWTNACCSHPRPYGADSAEGEAAQRLQEEMGFTTRLHHLTAFLYKADVAGGLLEHEYDHIYYGEYDGPVDPDPAEADEYQWLPLNRVADWLEQEPQAFTAWFATAFRLFLEHRPDKEYSL